MSVAAHDGTSLGLSVVSVRDLGVSVAYYSEFLGLTAHETVSWAGPDFERFWQVPAGTTAKAVLVVFPGSDVGQILLVEFQGPTRLTIRDHLERRFYGLY